jgi:hypothetical protein
MRPDVAPARALWHDGGMIRQPWLGSPSIGLGRTIIPIGLYVFYAFLSHDILMIVLTLPLFLSILLYSLKEKDPYVGENDILNAIYFLFFVISPMQAISEGQFLNPAFRAIIPLSTYSLTIASLIAFLFYNIYMFAQARFSAASRETAMTVPERTSVIVFVVLLAGLASAIAAFGSFENFMAPRYLKNMDQIAVTGLASSAAVIVCAIFLFAAAFGSAPSSGLQKVLAVLALVVLAVAVNHQNVARNVFFAAWFPILMIVLKGRLKPLTLHLAFVVAILFLMPIMSLTSREGYTLSASYAMFVEGFQDSINSPFSDVFQMLVACVWWFENVDFSYGWKTVGLLLFFVPRAIWPDKASLTGLDIGGYLYSSGATGTPNLSFFVGGDFYADFGLLGVAIGAVLTATIVYLAVYRRRIYANGWDIKGLLFMGCLPILIRGPVGANAGLIFCELIVFAILIRVVPLVPFRPWFEADERERSAAI